MQKKSLIIPCPILDANYQNYEDSVQILRAIEEWIFEIYKAAGIVHERPAPDHPDLSRNQSNHGQTFAYGIGPLRCPYQEIN